MNNRNDATNHCCAECGVAGGASLKICKSCMRAKYCNAECQRNHWPKHKKECKQRAAEIHDEALFKDPPAKEDCPICFLPMPTKLICCVSLPSATILSVPIDDFAVANDELAKEDMEDYYECCGQSVCKGCIHSFCEPGNNGKCPFCNSERMGKTEEEMVAETMKRVEVNDPASICQLGGYYYRGVTSIQQDQTKAIELFTKSAELGYSKAHNNLGVIYHEGGDMKKAKFHYGAAAMAGNEVARCNLGTIECESGNIERAVKHYKIAASSGQHYAMHRLRQFFEKGHVNRNEMDSTLIAYNNSCAEMRSESRDNYVRIFARIRSDST